MKPAFAVALLGALLTTTGALAEGWPERPIRLVVPFTPGGNVDVVARIVAVGLADDLKQAVIVENKPGANAAIGAEWVARSKPDGYTALLGTAETHALNPYLRKDLPYDPIKELPAVGIVDRFPFSLVVSPNLGASDLRQFIAYAKGNPGKLNFGSWGNGSTSQVAFEQIKQVGGIDLMHVPFPGAAAAITATTAGDVQAFVVPLSVAQPQAAGGRVKLIAVTGDQREATAPDVPTAKEQGVPVSITGWHVLAVPAGTPPEVMQRLNRALNAANANADVKEKLRKAGVQPATSTIDEAQRMVKDEYQRWGQVARKAGLEPQ